MAADNDIGLPPADGLERANFRDRIEYTDTKLMR